MMGFKLLIFDWKTLIYTEDKSISGFARDRDPKAAPRYKAGVKKYFMDLKAGLHSGTAVIAHVRPDVGKRYTLRATGAARSRWRHLTHEAAAIEQAENMAAGLGLEPTAVYHSFAWYDPTTAKAGLTPVERESDLNWSFSWRPPSSGMYGQALADHKAGPDQCLVIYEPNYMRIAADHLFLSHITGPEFFLGPSDKSEMIGRKRFVRRPLDAYGKGGEQ